jgi:nucleoside-diphosphate-sugar epimerase
VSYTEQPFDFTYALDAVAAMQTAACSEFTRIANIGGGNQVSINQVIATQAPTSRWPGLHSATLQRWA